MLGAGALDRRIEIQRNTPGAADSYNEKAASWGLLIKVWAKRTDVRDAERVAAGRADATVMSRFLVRSSLTTRSVTPKDRIIHDGHTWEILGVKQTRDGRDRFLEITAACEVS